MCSNGSIKNNNCFWIWKMNEYMVDKLIGLNFGFHSNNVDRLFSGSYLMWDENLDYGILY